MPPLPQKRSQPAKRPRQGKKPEKTADKIVAAMEKVMEHALRALAEEESVSPKEQKEIISLLMKAVEERAKITPVNTKPFNLTQTDKALLERYVQQRIAGTLPGAL